MNQKSLFPRSINNKAYIFPYVLFLNIFVLNIFILTLLICLNETKAYNGKVNYYHIFILEERAKRHVYEKVSEKHVLNYEQEILYYGEDMISLRYSLDEINQIWIVDMHIHYNNVNELAYIYYDINDDKLTLENR